MQDRPLYDHAALARLFEPRSIAVVGASPRPGSFGDRVLGNLASFAGTVWPINAKYDRVGDRPCFASVGALPAPPDCAIIVAGAEQAPAILDECARAGVGGAIVCASGFAEMGHAEGAAAQARLAAIGQAAGMPVVGPNCIGVVGARTDARNTFMVLDPPPVWRAGQPSIGLVSQSGALGFALSQAASRGVSFSHVLCSGNSCDVDVADCVAFLADSPDCQAIACVFEGMARPRRMLEAAALARARGKPLVVFKIASGEAGAAAALSHTGSLAGAHAAYVAAFRREGAVLVDAFEHLIETAAFFAKVAGRRPAGRGAAILATSGGAGILAADRAEQAGVPLPQPDAALEAVLRAHIPEFGAARNPCDVTAQVMNDQGSMDACAGALLRNDAYATMVLPMPYAYPPTANRIATYQRLATEAGKPVCVIWATEHLHGPGLAEAEAAEDVAVFRSATSCFTALAAWLAPRPRGTDDAPAIPAAARAEAAAILRTGGPMLGERSAMAALAPYGIPVVPSHLATTEDEAVRAAEALGLPVALKGESPGVAHKTEAGLVRLNIATTDAVRLAFRAIVAAAEPAPLTGVVVQPMLTRGVEMVIGGRVDPLFGPLILVGLGGVLVEVLADTALAPAPVGPAEARTMLAGLRGACLFGGFRDLPAVDMDRLAEIVSRASVFLAEQAEHVVELDINPLICRGTDVVAVDALIATRGK